MNFWICHVLSVAGHRGMVGTALVRRLERDGADILTADRPR